MNMFENRSSTGLVLFRFLRKILLSAGVSISRSADEERIRGALSLVRPSLFNGELARYGPEEDGGYLLPSELGSIDAVFSPGVADQAGFETHFAAEGIPCHLMDGSIDYPPVDLPNLNFEKLWLGPVSDPASGRKSLDDWVAGAPPSDNLILQMDIEGDEYAALLAASDPTLKKFKIIVIEFHNFISICSSHSLGMFEAILHRIRRTHFPVHTHVNNSSPPVKIGGTIVPNIFETTFVRLGDFENLNEFSPLPHPLDCANQGGKDWAIKY